MLYREGDPATDFYVMLAGSLAMYRRVGADDVEIARTGQVGVYAGAWGAYLGDRVPQTYAQTLRVLEPSRYYVLAAADFASFMNDWFPMAVHLLEGLFFGQQSSQAATGQRERLLALGSLSAGLTHELNNPAAAATRATATLRERVAGMRHKLAIIASGPYDREQLAQIIHLQEKAVAALAAHPRVRRGPDGAWRSPTSRTPSATGWTTTTSPAAGSSRRASSPPGSAPRGSTWSRRASAPEVLEGAVRWLAYTLETESLMNEVEDATGRISALVGAAKQYSQIGRAPDQTVDVHELLDSTLTMLDRQLGDGITVVRDYDRTLPPIHVFGAELNQVWTNLIDNAAQAMDGHGTLTLTTRRVDDWLEVEVADTGPGIPDGVVDRIFEPFFTTKPVGSGHGPRARHLVADRRRQAPRRPDRHLGAGRHPVPRPAALLPDGRTHPMTSTDHRPDRARRAGPAASSATRPTAGGSTCAAARPAGTSAAATPRPRSTRRRTSARPGTP